MRSARVFNKFDKQIGNTTLKNTILQLVRMCRALLLRSPELEEMRISEPLPPLKQAAIQGVPFVLQTGSMVQIYPSTGRWTVLRRLLLRSCR